MPVVLTKRSGSPSDLTATQHDNNMTAIENAVSSLEAADSGKANSSHTHSASDINSGTLDAARLPANNTALAGLTGAADRLAYFTDVGAMALATFTSFARTLLTAASSSAARTALGLGTVATQDASSVNITGGSVTGITDIAIADGGTGASSAGTARTNLDVPYRGATGHRISTLWTGTAAEYAALGSYDSETLYVVV